MDKVESENNRIIDVTFKDEGHQSLFRHFHLFQERMQDLDVYIEFVTIFNEFINHSMRPFRRIIDRDMRL